MLYIEKIKIGQTTGINYRSNIPSMEEGQKICRYLNTMYNKYTFRVTDTTKSEDDPMNRIYENSKQEATQIVEEIMGGSKEN